MKQFQKKMDNKEFNSFVYFFPLSTANNEINVYILLSLENIESKKKKKNLENEDGEAKEIGPSKINFLKLIQIFGQFLNIFLKFFLF